MGVRIPPPVQNDSVMINYIKESYIELKNHVTWPTLAQSQREMVLVVVFSVLFSLLIWGMDSFFEWSVNADSRWVAKNSSTA